MVVRPLWGVPPPLGTGGGGGVAVTLLRLSHRMPGYGELSLIPKSGSAISRVGKEGDTYHDSTLESCQPRLARPGLHHQQEQTLN